MGINAKGRHLPPFCYCRPLPSTYGVYAFRSCSTISAPNFLALGRGGDRPWLLTYAVYACAVKAVISRRRLVGIEWVLTFSFQNTIIQDRLPNILTRRCSMRKFGMLLGLAVILCLSLSSCGTHKTEKEINDSNRYAAYRRPYLSRQQ